MFKRLALEITSKNKLKQLQFKIEKKDIFSYMSS